MRNGVWFFFLIWWISVSATAQTVLPRGLEVVSIGSQVVTLEDTTNRLTINDINDTRRDWQPVLHPVLTPGFTPYPVWIRFTLPRPPDTLTNPASYILQLTNWYLDEADLYLPQPGGGYAIQRSGDQLPFAQRLIKTRFPAFRIWLTDQHPAPFYLKVRSTQYISMELQLSTDEAFAKSNTDMAIPAFTLGLAAMRIVFHIALLLLLFNDRRFRAYSLLGISVCLVYVFGSGNSSVFFADSPYWANSAFLLVISLVPLSLTYYVGVLFDIPRYYRQLVPVFWVVVVVCLLHIIANMVQTHTYLTQSFLVFVVILIVGLAGIGVTSYYRGIRPPVWYLMPLLVYFPPYVFYYAQNAYLYGNAAVYVGGTLQESSIRWAFTVEFLFVPFLMVIVLRQAYYDRIVAQQAVQRKDDEQQQMKTLDELKTRFFTNISHEFRTPLTLIMGPLSELKERLPAEPLLLLMERNSQRLMGLINQLLDMSKLEAGQLTVELEPGDIATFFRTLVSAFESLAHSRNIQFSFDQNKAELWADFDRDKLEKVLTNLLSNAFKFTPPGQTVHMDVQYPDDRPSNGLIITVQDTGVGIAADKLPRIFERFYQADSRANRSYEGTGVGLSLVHELVGVLGGTVSVSSVKGTGTRFTVTLPLLPVDRPQFVDAESYKGAVNGQLSELVSVSVPDNGEPDNQYGETDNRLLIIDDNADIRAYVRRMFQDKYYIIEAADGQEGLEKATSLLPDVVICDLMMPRMDGFAFCKALKTQEVTSHIPVLMLTAKATLEDRIEGFDLGADAYIPKPFDRTELTVRVNNLLQKKARLQRYFSRQESASVPVSEQALHVEDAFLGKLKAVVLQHLTTTNFRVDFLAGRMDMTQSQLVRKLKALTGQTAVEFIRNARLAEAATLLRAGNRSVSEVAYEVGFESLSYFTRVFQDKFGILPSAYTPTQPKSDL